MSIFTFAETTAEDGVQDFEAWWAAHVKPFIANDVEPVLKNFMSQFSTQFGQQALTGALAAVGSLATGASFAPVAVGLATTLYTDAKEDATSDAELDATQVLQTVQSALQVAKAANNVVTPADQTAATAIAAPASSGPGSAA